MIRKWIVPALFVLAAAALYFFENSGGTRIVLAASAALPALARGAKRRGKAEEKKIPVLQRADAPEEETEAGDVRPYVPGDPVRRIHWKLSAKMDRLLVREEIPAAGGPVPREEAAPAREKGGQGKAEGGRRKRLCLLLGGLMLLLLLLLALVPVFRNGFLSLYDRLLTKSEQRNPYVYDRVPVREGGGAAWAAGLLLVALGCWLGILAASKSPWPVLLTALLLSGVQIYYGVPLPAPGNVAAFAFLGFLLFRPSSLRAWGACCLALLLIAGLMIALWPGVDAATEAASERVRDRLSRAVGQAKDLWTEEQGEGPETRHVNTRALLPGEGEAQTRNAYHLVTVEEEQISRPPWIDWLRTVLLALLALALITLPFLPFLWLNSRRKKALEARKIFDSGDAREAVAAMFRHGIAWLEAAGCGQGNLLFRQWTEGLSGLFPPEYLTQFDRCAALFEEAAYSDHPVTEEDRARMRRFLEETETMLYARADWKQRLRIKYERCLCP